MMIGMHYNNPNNLQGRGGGFGSSSSSSSCSAYPMEAKCKKDGSFTNINEPSSVLDTWSPSPSTSTSTFSSLNNNTTQQGNMIVNELPATAVRGGGGKENWVADPQPPPHNARLEGLENLSQSTGKQNEILNPNFLGFGAVNKNPHFTQFCGGSAISPLGNVFSSYNNINNSAVGLSGSGSGLASYITFPDEFETLDQKVDIFNPEAALNQILVQNAPNQNMNHINPLLFGTHQQPLNSNLGSMNTKLPIVDPGHNLIDPGHVLVAIKQQNLPPSGFFQPPNFIPPHMPLLVPKQEPIGVNEHQQIVYDQLYKAAELIQAGNFCNAQGILARLNQILSPIGKPFERSAFYVKQALELAFTMPNKIPTPFDGMFKMGAYKVFSEVSPFIRFSNFTANQVILEALDGAEQIHIIDFDIGFGAHWSSFLQELPRNNRGVTSVKITAFASPSTHHSVEISLMHENLTQFANELGIKFELEVVNIDSFDPNLYSVSSFRSSETEFIAVNFPIWSFANYLSALPSYLCFIKKLSPKILVSLDCGCERIDLPFPRHVFHTLQYYEALVDSVDSANLTSEVVNKIEKFIFQPRIESIIMGRLVYPHIIPPWRNLFTSAGFIPTSLSTFAETQAECVLKRTQVRGFHVERRNASSLVLSWQRGELLSVSAWN